MQVRKFEIHGPLEITPQRFGDDRGYFTETFNAAKFLEAGVNDPTWVQDNQSLSMQKHTLRGLHYQLAPHAQAKIVRVLKGSILDVAVDIRPASPAFGKWIAVELSAAKGNQLYVPTGFAHGFLTLEDNCEIAYKVSAFYAKESDRSIIWNDRDIAIQWGLPPDGTPILSAKDANAASLAAARQELH